MEGQKKKRSYRRRSRSRMFHSKLFEYFFGNFVRLSLHHLLDQRRFLLLQLLGLVETDEFAISGIQIKSNTSMDF